MEYWHPPWQSFFAYRALFPPKPKLTVLASQSRGEGKVASALVSVRNDGRHAIATEQFEGGVPLVIGLGPSVTAVLSVALTPDRGRVPLVEVADGSLRYPPFLLRPGETLSVQAQLEHAAAEVELKIAHQLKDVEIVEAPPRVAGVSRLLIPMITLAAGVAIVFVGLGFWRGLIGKHLTSDPNPLTAGREGRVCGSGFEPFAMATGYLEYPLTEAQALLFTGQVDSRGSFCETFEVPSDAKVGNGVIEVYIDHRGGTSIRGVDVSVVS